MKKINPIAIIPHYNHSNTISRVVQDLNDLGLPVIIIDDGSDNEHCYTLQKLAQNKDTLVIFRSQNGGKGAAVKQGLQEAFNRDYTHALQIDADGQHKITDAMSMLKKTIENPTALICGKPIYGNDAPKSRLYGRKITNFWNIINTLSMDIKDGMCGFRIYPLESTIPIIQKEYIGNYMDFDNEILIRMHWQKIPIIWVDTPVKYKTNGISHFRAWKDNWLISKMHARLFLGMLKRILMGKHV